ncbi:hypothetical protein [Actinomadura sp. NPDC049753]|uniref:hypothetical protein n=1 Tax=Actinomadura sp. NPDC049753 TaxID=3154739 RepID=UPI003443EAE3
MSYALTCDLEPGSVKTMAVQAVMARSPPLPLAFPAISLTVKYAAQSGSIYANERKGHVTITMYQGERSASGVDSDE